MNAGMTPGVALFVLLLVAAALVSPWFLVGAAVPVVGGLAGK